MVAGSRHRRTDACGRGRSLDRLPGLRVRLATVAPCRGGERDEQDDGPVREQIVAGGPLSAFVRLHPLLNPLPPTAIGTLVRHGVAVSIDLTLPTEELWAQTRLNHRRDITRAVRLGYVARMDEDWRHLESFKHLYRATMARRSAAPFYFFEDDPGARSDFFPLYRQA